MDNARYMYDYDIHGKYSILDRIVDTAFDTKDVIRSHDIIEEYIEDVPEGYDQNKFKDYAFFDQENNDGKLLIDVYDNDIRYCFLDWNGSPSPVMTAKEYLDWDGVALEDKKIYDDNFRRFTADNIQAIEEMATLMSPSEVEDFFDTDYSVIPQFQPKN
jgi:hypothetical protein